MDACASGRKQPPTALCSYAKLLSGSSPDDHHQALLNDESFPRKYYAEEGHI